MTALNEIVQRFAHGIMSGEISGTVNAEGGGSTTTYPMNNGVVLEISSVWSHRHGGIVYGDDRVNLEKYHLQIISEAVQMRANATREAKAARILEALK